MKVKFLIAALFFSLVAAAQPSNYIKFNTRGRWIAGMFDSTLHVPRFNGSPSLRTGGSSMDGAIAIDTTNGIFYFYQGGSWKRANLDTSAYAVTSVYRKTASDSVFYVKGGVHTFAFKDSTGASSYTFTNGLSESGGTVKLGGDLVDATTTINGKNKVLVIDSSLYLYFISRNTDIPNNDARILIATDEGIISTFDNGTINSSININNVISFTALNSTTSVDSKLEITPDSIKIYPPLGRLTIDTLNYTISTTGKKILIRDTATGLVQNIDPSLLGGGSSSLSSITAATATNTINNGNYKQEWQWDNLSSGYGLDLTSSTTSPASTVGLLNSTIDGANSNAGITSYAIIGQNYKTGTSSTNYGASFTASGGTTNIGAIFTAAGGTNNYAITVPSSGGSVGIGTETPASKLHTVGTVRHATLGTASGDTTTNKPVGINSSGDIIPMTHWPGGGGSTSPGGSTKQIQYNNAGSFGGAAGFEYQAAASPNVLIKGQGNAYIPLIVKGVDSSQTADLFRVSRYEDSAMFRVAANGSVTIGPAYDYANAIHAPGHEFRYSNAGYTGGIKIRNHNSGSIVRLQTVNNGLFLTDDGGSAAAMTLGTRTNPADASTFIAASGSWTISAGRFGVGGTADASAIIAATSTTKGFLPPKMTGTQAEAITSPAEGLMVYATDGSGTTITSKGWWGYDGSVWTKLN